MDEATADQIFAETHGIDPAIFAKRWWTLAVLCTSLMIVIIGNTVLNVALPTLARELDADLASQQWMVDSYGLVFAGLLFSAGAIGDRYGRKGALQVGLLVFLAGSLFAALNDTAGAVIAGRVVMGIGAALVMPSTLSILTNVFPPHERTRAIAIWAGIAGSGAALGPITGGLLLEHFWWGSVFLVNVPVIVIALVAGRVLVPRSRDPHEQRLDAVGALLSIAAVGTLVYAIIEAPNHGWASAESVVLFLAAVVLLAAFIVYERRIEAPMLDMHYFTDRRFSVASGSLTLVFFAMFGTVFLLTQYFQLVLGYGTLEAGLRPLPFPIAMMLTAPNSPKIAARIGGHRMVAGGLAIVAVALLAFTWFDAQTSYWWIAVGVGAFGFGMALTMSPLTASIMSSVPRHRAGVGSSMNDTARELGGALGVAVLGSLMASRYRSHIDPALAAIDPSLRDEAHSGLAGALQTAPRLPGEARAALLDRAQDAFMSGFHLAYGVAAAVAAIGAVVVWRMLPQRPGPTLAGAPADTDQLSAPVG